MPPSEPSPAMSAAPPQLGWAGLVKIASSSRYSQYPANSCFAATRAAIALALPPPPATTTRSPTRMRAELPSGKAGRFTRPSAWTSPNPVSWS